jgi:hypothetical protein
MNPLQAGLMLSQPIRWCFCSATSAPDDWSSIIPPVLADNPVGLAPSVRSIPVVRDVSVRVFDVRQQVMGM